MSEPSGYAIALQKQCLEKALMPVIPHGWGFKVHYDHERLIIRVWRPEENPPTTQQTNLEIPEILVDTYEVDWALCPEGFAKEAERIGELVQTVYHAVEMAGVNWDDELKQLLEDRE